MEAFDRLEDAKADLHTAKSKADADDAREEIDHWNRKLFRGGFQEFDQ